MGFSVSSNCPRRGRIWVIKFGTGLAGPKQRGLQRALGDFPDGPLGQNLDTGIRDMDHLFNP